MIGRLVSGRYRLIAPLGEGGMATIWRAVDEQLDREVAVKILRPQFSSDPGFAARFKQEARSAGGLSHPNIVGVYDYGTDAGDVKVTDFGIARAVAEASMTVTGTTLGSVHYFSPEQARGDEVTGASDVYALGIVLYEMLTGRRPFEADSAAAVALRRLNEDAPTPTAVGRPQPPGLEAIVMRALEREPTE